MAKLAKNTILELDIESIGSEGVAIARRDEVVHFVKGAVPGDKVRAMVTKKKSRYVFASTVEVLSSSDERETPPCRYFGVCGGCSWQNMKYDRQLFWKRKNVEDCLTRIGKAAGAEYYETMPSPSVFNYRNKMEFSFGWSRWLTNEEINSEDEIQNKEFALGLHVPERFDKVLDVEECHIQPAEGNRILKAVREISIELGCKVYDQRSHVGFLRNLVIRSSKANNELMVILITTNPTLECERRMILWFETEFVKLFPHVTNLIHAINDTFSPVATGDVRIIKGTPYITEEILGIKYRISPFSFFQTNSFQLDRFIGKILEFADLKPTDMVWDLYCGTGSITLPAARQCSEIFGFELVESSVADAKMNAVLNGIDNALFFKADLHGRTIPEMLLTTGKPDVIIVDPPRAGMHKNLVEHVAGSGARKIVYVSCNPATQARDCELLSENYSVVKVQPVDMFPHTFHVESVALLIKKD